VKTIKTYENQNVIILGLAKSGLAASKLLHRLGANVTVTDRTEPEEEVKRELEKEGISSVFGEHPLSLLDNAYMVVKNPGIPYRIPFLQEALKREIPVITEVELSYELSEAPIIGITGSNGKTTTTTLIYEILAAAQREPLIAGNIGTVSCEVGAKAEKDQVIVTELSSFQLMGIREYKPKIAVLLNIFDAHLDYHSSKEEYVEAKFNLFSHQDEEDYAVINADDPVVSANLGSIKSKVVPFSRHKELKEGAYLSGNKLMFQEEEIISWDDVLLKGEHNIENVLAAIATCKLYGASTEAIVSVLKTFTGVKHRMQYVTNIQGRAFYNDSKATNILATKAALSGFKENVILLAGGLDRGNGFEDLEDALSCVKALVTFGETAPKLEESAKNVGIQTIKRVDNVEKAVAAAYKLSEEGDVILLSPACASWDQFKTFEERGDMFINCVHKLK
jgi:UDP-N-acetylmuramoylalanine--D-glutamate ligase